MEIKKGDKIMKLLMKERKFTIRDKFSVQDENGRDKYQVIGELISATKTLHIRDMNGNEMASIQEKMISLKPKFYLVIDGERVGEIVKDVTLLKPKYHISGLEWAIKGDVSEHKYSILSGKKTIVTVKKKRLALAGTYVFDIEDEVLEIPALAAVLAIDYITNN